MLSAPPKGKPRPRREPSEKSLHDLEHVEIVGPTSIVPKSTSVLSEMRAELSSDDDDDRDAVKHFDFGSVVQVDSQTHMDLPALSPKMKPPAAAASPPPSSPPAAAQPSAASEEPTVHRRGTSKQFDALAMLHEGTSFLKFGRHGYPHYRHVQLMDNNRVIQWFSKNKSLDDCQVDLGNVQRIQLGQTTPNFRRYERARDFDHMSFSIVYGDGKRSLDLVAKEASEYVMWTKGLMQLVMEVKSGKPVGDLVALVVDMDQMHIVQSMNVPPEWNADDASSPSSPASRTSTSRASTSMGRRLSAQSNSGNQAPEISYDKGQAADVIKLEQKLHSRMTSLQDLVRATVKRRGSQHENSAMVKFQQLQTEVVALRELLVNGEYRNADRLCNRLMIEASSLDSMLKALKPKK